ncbi:mechanosensitive ion channel family protein [Qipengyuania thermophila]|uniref:mechanosensitive ion channel family protein n=1 Tax=Qipengyuania thermophila TaxID=2509361 RepID=UPI0013EBA2DF|nr:mechanosensitive ion channel family protein [Qipengyuania thermophila]
MKRAEAQVLGLGESAASPTPAADPYGRDTPRSTVTRLLRALADRDYVTAGQIFALPAERQDEAADLARALQAALDAGGTLRPYAELSNDPAGATGDGLPADQEQVGTFGGAEALPILLQRTTAEDGSAFWQIAPATLDALESIDIAVPPAAADATERGPTIAGAPVADWLRLAGVLVLLFAGFWLLSRLLLFAGRRLGNAESPAYHLLNAALPPLALVLALVTFRIHGGDAEVSIIARQTMLRYLGILNLLALLWFALRLVNGITNWLSNRMQRAERRQAASVIVFARRVIKILLLLFAAIGVLDTLGFNVTTGLAALGLGGLVLALGAQKSVENLVGTLSVLADRPVQVGDFCRVGDVSGTVEDIGIRSTRIRTTERTVISIPNGDFSSRHIENFSQRDRFLFQMIFGVDYEAEPAQLAEAAATIAAVLHDHPQVGRDPCRAVVKGHGPDAYEIEALAYIETTDFGESLAVRQELLLSIYRKLAEAGIPLASATRAAFYRRDPAAGAPRA